MGRTKPTAVSILRLCYCTTTGGVSASTKKAVKVRLIAIIADIVRIPWVKIRNAIGNLWIMHIFWFPIALGGKCRELTSDARAFVPHTSPSANDCLGDWIPDVCYGPCRKQTFEKLRSSGRRKIDRQYRKRKPKCELHSTTQEHHAVPR